MGRITPPMARNMIRRALIEMIDKSPSKSEISQVWEYFGSACAYCGRALMSGEKQAHLDHLISSSAGGRNHIANRVLACAACNEHEKREMDWEIFLRLKAESEAEFLSRKRRIEKWTTMFPVDAAVLAPEVFDFARECADEAVRAFSIQADRIRALRDVQQA
jgi:hypothetical protein